MVDMCVGRLALEWVVLCFADRSCSIEALCTLAHRCNSMYVHRYSKGGVKSTRCQAHHSHAMAKDAWTKHKK